MAERHKTIRALAIVCTAVLVLLPACQKSQQPSAPASASAPTASPASRAGAIITFLSGDVSVTRGGGLQPAEIGMSLNQEDSLKVGPLSSCEVQFGVTAMIHIGQNTTLALNSLSLEPQHAQVTVGLVAGIVACKVISLATGEKFRVKTATAVMGVRGTEFVVGYAEGKDALLAVQKGEVAVLPPWAELEALRSKVKDSTATLAPLEQQLEENALLVKPDQQLLIKAETSRKWEKELAPLEQKINDLAARADKGEEVTRESVEQVAAAAEKLEPSLARSLGETTAISDEPAKALAAAASMSFLEMPAASPAAVEPEKAGLVGVVVTVQPPDATIYVNGALSGTGECSGIYSPGQKLEFRVVREGYQEKSVVITTEKGGKDQRARGPTGCGDTAGRDRRGQGVLFGAVRTRHEALFQDEKGRVRREDAGDQCRAGRSGRILGGARGRAAGSAFFRFKGGTEGRPRDLEGQDNRG